MSKDNQVIVIGAGFAGLAAASILAQAGQRVTIVEKNNQAGGRARIWEHEGFRFDMGPSWYWMPDVFENYFALFGKSPADYYQLKRLDPGYRVYFGKNDFLDVPADMAALEMMFENIEPGSAAQLRKFLGQAEYKYRVGMGEYVFRPSHSVFEYFDLNLVRKSIGLQLLTDMGSHVRKYFKNERLIQLLEFPVLFLGATPQNTPAMYSMMNYADLALGTWYPMGGMNEIVKAMVSVAKELGVKIETNTEAQHIEVENGKAKALQTNCGRFEADFIIAGADYEHVDQQLLDALYRNYSKKYWDSRTLSPSCLLYYVGLDKRIDGVQHHNLFFDEDFNRHARDIYTTPRWPEKPLFYVSCPSKTDSSIAPAGFENMFFLMPIAPGLPDGETVREQYFELMLSRFEAVTGQHIRDNIIVKRSYSVSDFKSDYHSFKGNAYGLANTLQQTAFLKPAMRAKKVKNLLYTGQLTVPGPGVPPALISGQIAAAEALKILTSSL